LLVKVLYIFAFYQKHFISGEKLSFDIRLPTQIQSTRDVIIHCGEKKERERIP